MIRSLFIVVMIHLALVGCGKKKDGGGIAVDPATQVDESSPVYTIKIRDKQAGDRFEVNEISEDTFNNTLERNGKLETFKGQSGERYEYTEIIEASEGGKLSLVKRTYRVANATRNDKTQDASFVGKTVTIQHQENGRYSCRVEPPVEITGGERVKLEGEFRGGGRDPLSVLVPSQPHRVNEVWNLEPALLQKAFDPFGKSGDMTGVGKLTRVYSKGERQFGSIEIKINITMPKLPPPGLSPDSFWTHTFVYDGCIDGTILEGETKLTTAMNLSSQDAKTGAVTSRVSQGIRTINIKSIIKK